VVKPTVQFVVAPAAVEAGTTETFVTDVGDPAEAGVAGSRLSAAAASDEQTTSRVRPTLSPTPERPSRLDRILEQNSARSV
jgi:hypothetical protein